MVDRNDFTANNSNKVEKLQLEFTLDDNLLKYLARKNVQDRRNLIRHIVAFFVALLIFYIFVGSSTYWVRVEANAAINLLYRVMITQHDYRKVHHMFRLRNPKIPKPDPVAIEYARLKSMASEKKVIE